MVHDALGAMKERGVQLYASREALAAFANAPAPLTPAEATKPPEAAPPSSFFPKIPMPPAVDPLPVALAAAVQVEATHGTKAERLAALRAPALICQRCPHLARTRTQVVFGGGNPEAEILFVGEAPGADEDRLGEPFIGAAGQLLTKIFTAMGYAREDLYIANVLKCRPDMPGGASGNRKPTGEEMRTCLPYLEEQIRIVQPRAIVALGATAMEGLLGTKELMGKLRGRWHDFHGTPLMATYHPSYLLRNQSMSEKRKVWEDMLLVLERLEKTVSDKQRAYFTK